MVRYTGTGKGTGKELDLPVVHIWDVRNGKLAQFRQFIDTAKFLRSRGGGLRGIRDYAETGAALRGNRDAGPSRSCASGSGLGCASDASMSVKWPLVLRVRSPVEVAGEVVGLGLTRFC